MRPDSEKKVLGDISAACRSLVRTSQVLMRSHGGRSLVSDLFRIVDSSLHVELCREKFFFSFKRGLHTYPRIRREILPHGWNNISNRRHHGGVRSVATPLQSQPRTGVNPRWVGLKQQTNSYQQHRHHAQPPT